MKSRSILKKLFLSYILIMILALVMSFISTSLVITNMLEMTDENLQNKSEAFARQLDNYVVEYGKRAVQISTIEKLGAEKMFPHGVSTKEGIRYLGTILMMDDFLNDIILAYGENLYTNSGFVSLETYCELVLGRYAGYSSLMKQMFYSEEFQVLYVPAGDFDYLLLHYPMKSNMEERIDSVNFCIRMDQIYEELEGWSEQMRAQFQITFENSYQTEKIFLCTESGEKIEKIEQAAYEEAVAKSDRIVKIAKSEQLGMRLQISYEKAEVYRQILLWRRITEIILGGFLLLSIVISYKISASHYEKILYLKESIGNVLTQQEGIEYEKHASDFDVMQTMVRSIGAQTDQMRAEAERTRNLMRQQMAMLLFYGGIREEKQICGMLECCGIVLQEGYYTIACITGGRQSGLLSKKNQMLVEQNISCHAIIEGKEAVLVLFELPDEDLLKVHREAIAQRVLKTDDVKIAFSQTFEKLNRTPAAYLEAINICQRLLMMDTKVGYLDMILGVQERYNRFEEGALERFEDAVRRGEYQLAENRLDMLLNDISSRDLSADNQKYLRYHIIQSMLLCVNQLQENRQEDIKNKIMQIDIDSTEAIKEKVCRVLMQICKSEEENYKVQFRKIVDYINMNFQRPDLSQDEVAEKVGLSRSHLSRIFKEKTGVSYIDYLTKCRMEHARKLLEETEISIKEISFMVGYTNIPGFRNKFKEYYGVNASEYRKRVQK